MIPAIAIADDDSLIGHLDLNPNPDTIGITTTTDPSHTADRLLISLGDLFDSTIEKAFARYHCKTAFAVKGNHDSSAPFPSFIKPLHCTIETFQGLTFAGFDGSWKYKPVGHHLYEQGEVTRILRHFPRVDVFIAHNSPAGIHERDTDVHQGFHAFLDYIHRTQPHYFIHGHQHLNQITQIGQTKIISIYGEKALHL